jgi:hypothetical protein
MQAPMLPFKVLVLAPFKAGEPDTGSEKRIAVSIEDLDQVLSELGVNLYVPISETLCPAGGIDLRFTAMKDFHPDGIIGHPFFRNLAEAGKFAVDAVSQGLSETQIAEKLHQWQGLPKLTAPSKPLKKSPKESGDSLENILNLVSLTDNRESPASGLSLKAQLDAVSREILKQIFSNDGFRNLESVWRGLHFLIRLQPPAVTGKPVSFEIHTVTAGRLEETLSKLTADLMDDLPSLVLLDIGFDSTPQSLHLLDALAVFSETIMVPSAAWISHRFFYLESWEEIGRLGFLPNLIDSPEYAKWRRLKESRHGKWVIALCNRFLTRYPFGPDNTPRHVEFTETTVPWTSPVWAFGALACRSVGHFGWPTHLTDWHHVRLEDLPLSGRDPANPIPTEANFSRDRIDQFLRTGITPMVSQKKQDIAFMPGETTVGGESFCYQSLISHVTQLILWCQDSFPRTSAPEELRMHLETVFRESFSGTGGVDQLEIHTGVPGEAGRIPVHIRLKPSRRVLLSGKTIELDFSW